jgi:hypothetical protein
MRRSTVTGEPVVGRFQCNPARIFLTSCSVRRRFRNGLIKAHGPGYLFRMDPTLSGFALGLLLAAGKVGAVGTVVFGIAWWRTRTKLRRLEADLPDPASLAERLANLEQMADYSASQLDRLIESQDALARQLVAPPAKASLPEA